MCMYSLSKAQSLLSNGNQYTYSQQPEDNRHLYTHNKNSKDNIPYIVRCQDQ